MPELDGIWRQNPPSSRSISPCSDLDAQLPGFRAPAESSFFTADGIFCYGQPERAADAYPSAIAPPVLQARTDLRRTRRKNPPRIRSNDPDLLARRQKSNRESAARKRKREIAEMQKRETQIDELQAKVDELQAVIDEHHMHPSIEELQALEQRVDALTRNEKYLLIQIKALSAQLYQRDGTPPLPVRGVMHSMENGPSQ